MEELGNQLKNKNSLSLQDKARIYYHFTQILIEKVSILDDLLLIPEILFYNEDNPNMYCQAMNFIKKIIESLTPNSAIIKWVKKCLLQTNEVDYYSFDYLK